MFPAPMRAMCAQVWLVPTSTRALRPLERAVAARWVAARHRRPRAAAAKSRFLRFCRVCQTPCSPCAYRIARSRRSAVPYTAWSKCRQRGGQLHGIGDSLLRSQSRAVSPRCMGGTKKSSCDFSVLCGPGVLYHVPITCTNTTGWSEQLFPDWAETSTPDFGPSAHCD